MATAKSVEATSFEKSGFVIEYRDSRKFVGVSV
jgi:hypothetical protein